jgi:hypothetical protein
MRGQPLNAQQCAKVSFKNQRIVDEMVEKFIENCLISDDVWSYRTFCFCVEQRDDGDRLKRVLATVL